MVLGAIGGHKVKPFQILAGTLVSDYGAATAGIIPPTFFTIVVETFSSIPDEISDEVWLLVEKEVRSLKT